MISLLVFFLNRFLKPWSSKKNTQVRCNSESFIFNISLRNGIQRSNPVDMSVTPRRRPFNGRWEHIGSMGYTQSSMARYSGVVVEPTHLKHMIVKSSNWIISPNRGEKEKSLKPSTSKIFHDINQEPSHNRDCCQVIATGKLPLRSGTRFHESRCKHGNIIVLKTRLRHNWENYVFGFIIIVLVSKILVEHVYLGEISHRKH